MEEPVTVEALDQLVDQISKKRQEIDEAELIVTGKNKELSSLQEKAASYLKELNRDSYKAPFGTISKRNIWRVSLPKTDEDKAKLFDWLREKGIFERYATVNSNSLNSLYMAEWEEAKKSGEGMGFEIPGVGQPSLFESLAFRKA